MVLDLSSMIPALAFIPYVLFMVFGVYRGKNEQLNVPFLLYMMFMAIWSFGAFMMHANTGIHTPLFWNRVMLIGLLGVPIGIFHSVLSLIKGIRRGHIFLVVLGYCIYIFLQYMNFRGAIVTAAWFEGTEFFYTLAEGSLFTYALCYVYLIGGIYVLINELIYTKNDQLKRKLRIPLIGTIILISGVLINLYEPLGRYPIDLAAATVNAFCLFYAIYRFKLVYYSALVMQTILYIVLITLSVFVFIGIIWLTFSSVRNIPLRFSILPSLLLGVVAAIIFQPLRLGTQGVLEKLVFGKRFLYFNNMKAFLESSSSIVELDLLGSSTIDKIRETFDLEWACMIVTDYTSRTHRVVAANDLDLGGREIESINFGGTSPLQPDTVSYREILYMPEDEETIEVSVGGKKTVLFPGLVLFLRFKKRLNGFILLGRPTNKDYFDQFDTELLELLARQCAITLENAISFERLKRQQKKLQNLNQDLVLSRNMLQAYFDGITTPISIQDVNYNIVAANVAASHYFNKPLKDLIGMKCYVVYFHRVKPCEACMAQDCCHAQIPYSAELGDLNTDMVFEISYYPINSSVGRDMLFLEFFKDITQQRKLQEELKQSEKLAAIGTLASGIASEINNPLYSIIGTAQTLFEDAEPGTHVQELTKDILKNAKAAAEVIQELTSYSSNERQELRYVDVTEILSTTLKLATRGMDFSNITVRTDFESLPLIEVSASELQQVILNIIINAAHAMSEGGELALSCSHRNSIIYIGIATTDLPVEADGSDGLSSTVYANALREKGALFELSICQQIMFKMSGRIDVQKKAGSGSEVIISLPASAIERDRIRYIHAKTSQEIDDVFFLQRKILVGEKGYIEETIRNRRDEGVYHLVAYRGLQPVGTVTCTLRKDGGRLPVEDSFRLDRFKDGKMCAEIERLAVMKEERGSLIPLGLMMSAYIYLRASGAERIFLDVFSDEEKLVHMYNKLGFVYIGEYLAPLPVSVMFIDQRSDYETENGRLENFVKPFISRLFSKLDMNEEEMSLYRDGAQRITNSSTAADTEFSPAAGSRR